MQLRIFCLRDGTGDLLFKSSSWPIAELTASHLQVVLVLSAGRIVLCIPKLLNQKSARAVQL